MSTLFDQPVRHPYKVDFEVELDYFMGLSKRHRIPLSELIALKATLEQQRTNDLRLWDGDAKDEQLAGFGEIARNIPEQLGFALGEIIEKAISDLCASIETAAAIKGAAT